MFALAASASASSRATSAAGPRFSAPRNAARHRISGSPRRTRSASASLLLPAVARLRWRRSTTRDAAGEGAADKGETTSTEGTEPDDDAEVQQDDDGAHAGDEKRASYNGVDVQGGVLGYGKTVDDALEATTNPDLFIFGALALTVGAILAFLFGPRPPSDYYG